MMQKLYKALFCILSTLLDQWEIVNVCIYKTFYEYFFLLKIQVVFQARKKFILDWTLQDVALQLTDPKA